jgi:hypothetical protein
VAPAAISAIAQIFETKKAADTQSSAAADATAAELGMFATGQAALQPYISGGAKDLGLLTGTPGHPAVPAHWATASGKDVVRGANWHPTPAVQATWKNPQGQTVQMAPAWKPGPAQKGWVLQSPGAVAGHATPSKWVGPGGAIVNKPWNWKPPAGQAQHWTLKTPGQQPTVGWTQKSKGSAAVAGTTGALQDTFMKPIVMDQAALEKTPGYQFQLAQGLKSGVSALTARGLGPTSGAAVKGAETYAEGLASENYQQQFANALANKNMEWNALYGTGQLGESAGAHIAQQAATTGSNVASNIVGSGAVQAGADIATANAVTGITNTLSLQQLAANQRALAQISPPAATPSGSML